jgi:cytoskeletal protein CcmA (bactofilin family)
MMKVIEASRSVSATATSPDVPSASKGQTIEIVGVLTSSEDLIFSGKLSGSVRCDGTVTIRSGAELNANVTARSVTLEGTVKGNVDVSDKIDIRNGAKLMGDVSCTRISIEDGAYFKGYIDLHTRNIAPAIIGSADASHLDDLAEEEIARGAYEELVEESLFRRSGRRPISAPVVVESAKYNVISH